MMKISVSVIACLVLVGMLASTNNAMAAGHARVRGAHANAAGGVSGGSAVFNRGPNGGASARGHVHATDGQGNVVAGSAAALRGPNGGSAWRSGRTTRNADGSVTHQSSGYGHSAAGGSFASSGSSQRIADGTRSGSRTTTATGANGYSYQGSTTASGGVVTHASICRDPNGNEIACR